MAADVIPAPGDDAAAHRPRQRRGAQGLRHWLIGPAPISRLTITHCLHSSAEAFFTVSMAGSIFFSVSVDAARPRVLLFLVLTLGPFLVMAPLVGPIVDRLRGGLGTAMVATFVIRAVLALLLAEHLRGIALFPLAFGVLVIAKSYTVSRNALVPSLVPDEGDLVAANARLSRTATMAGALAAAGAVSVYTATAAEWSLRVGAVVYLVGAFAAWRVRAAAPPIEPLDHAAIVELVRPDVSGAVRDMMALRAAIGFALFQYAFSLRADGASPVVLGAVLVANSIGGFIGTVVSPLLRQRMTERAMFTTALVSAALAALVAGLFLGTVTLVGAILVLGLAVSVGRRALDATVQRHAPHARRGQVYAGLETRLELVWVAAACLAVALRVDTWIGALALAVFLLFAVTVHVRRRSGLSVLASVATVPLPERLLLRAQTLADHGYYDEAVILAAAAVDTAEREDDGGDDDPDDDGHHGPVRSPLSIEDVNVELDRARARIASRST